MDDKVGRIAFSPRAKGDARLDYMAAHRIATQARNLPVLAAGRDWTASYDAALGMWRIAQSGQSVEIRLSEIGALADAIHAALKDGIK